MKVLHFYKSYLPEFSGGIGQVINQLARGSVHLGVNSQVLTLSPDMGNQTLEVDGHKVHICRTNFELASAPFSFSAFKKFQQLAREVDIVHYHYPYPFADLLHFVARSNKPSLLTYHSDIIKQKRLLKIYKPLMSRFLSDIDHIVATSPNYLESSKVLAQFKNKTSVIPIGLDKKLYPAVAPERLKYWSKRLGPRFFFFVGVLRYYKGLHTLVEAASGANYPVIIAGSGPLEQELKASVAKLGAQNIYFLGHLLEDDKMALLELCYSLVFPSHLRSEAFGISLLEGAMYSKALISCEIGTGTTYINIDGKTGLSVPPDDPKELRRAMDYIWDNPEKTEKMGKRAKERYLKLFTADKMVNKYLEIYQSLCS